MRPSDTTPEAWEILLNIYREMSPEDKLRRTFEISQFVRSLCESGVRAQYPEASEREIFLRVTRRTLGEELFEKVYPNQLPSA